MQRLDDGISVYSKFEICITLELSKSVKYKNNNKKHFFK